MSVDERLNFGFDARAFYGFDDQAALPPRIERGRHVLGRAAAASPIPGAEGFCALRSGVQDLDEFAARAGKHDAHALAGQGVRDNRAAVGDAIAMRVERDDSELMGCISHGAPRSGILSLQRGRAPATSASPPVFTSGKISEATDRTCTALISRAGRSFLA